MSFFIQNAYGGSAESAASSGYGSLILLAGFILIFYFLLWRPQSKRAKDHRALINNLAKGDEVVTTGGMAGKITNIDESFITLEISPNVQIKIQKNAVSTTLPKGTIKG